jgi:valyl-tRNA synthetase
MRLDSGNDVRLSDQKVEGYRNFTTKLWNICRFMALSIEDFSSDAPTPTPVTLSDKWILRELHTTIADVTEKLEKYDLSIAGDILRDFTWNRLADWYLEIAKVEGAKSDILNYILLNVLKLWHPFMPFVTESLYQELYGDGLLLVSAWPEAGGVVETVIEFDTIINYVTEVRRLRAEYRIEPAKKISIFEMGESAVMRGNRDVLMALARIEDISYEKVPTGLPSFTLNGITIYLDVVRAIDKSAEVDRMTREIATVEPYTVSLEQKLSDSNFVDNAPAAVVAKEREKLSEAHAKLKNLKDQLGRL